MKRTTWAWSKFLFKIKTGAVTPVSDRAKMAMVVVLFFVSLFLLLLFALIKFATADGLFSLHSQSLSNMYASLRP